MKIKSNIILNLFAMIFLSTPIVFIISCGQSIKSEKKSNKSENENIDNTNTDNVNNPFTNQEVKDIINDRFTKKLIKTKRKGAIAETNDNFHNPVLPFGYKGKVGKYDIVLQTKEAQQIIKNTLSKGRFIYLTSYSKTKIVPRISAKAFLKFNKYQYFVVDSKYMQQSTIKNEPLEIKPKPVGNITYDYNDKYYATANGLKGEKLLNKMHEIQGQHITNIKLGSVGYGELYNTYSKAFRDNIFEHDNSLIDIYSENPNSIDPYNFLPAQHGGNYKKEGDIYNREHIVPQSWFNKKTPMRNDAQFVWPSDGKVNGMRSNYPHAIVSTVIKESRNHSKLGINNQYGGKVFEPIDRFKGDVARAYLYFALTYYETLNISKSGEVFTDSFPYIKDNFLNLYIKWAKEDPVDQFDFQRNIEIYKIQGNRNPFIDYPDLIDNIWNINHSTQQKDFINKGIATQIQ